MIDALEKATQDWIAREEYLELEGREKGMKIGLEKGMEKGIEKGIEKAKLEDAITIISKLHLSVTKTMEVLEMPEELREQLIAELEKQKISYTL